MPFRHLWRELDSYQDFQQRVFQHHPSQLAIVDSDSFDRTWYEMDYTTTPLIPPSGYQQISADKSSPMLSTRQHSSNSSLNADFGRPTSSWMDNAPYRRLPKRRKSSEAQKQAVSSTLPHILSQTPSMTQEASGAALLNNAATMTNDPDHLMYTSNEADLSLCPSDVLSTSLTIASTELVTSSVRDNPVVVEGICPLLAGQTDRCEPSLCGPDAPCMSFAGIPPIEECTSAPCIPSSTPPDKTHIDNFKVNRRPGTSTQASTTTISSSAISRRSYSSSSTPPPHVPVSSGRNKNQTKARQTRTTRAPAQSDVGIELDSHTDSNNNTQCRPPSTTTQGERPLSEAEVKQRAKQAHSLVERKYRENLNAKISLLHNTLLNSRYGPLVVLDESSLPGGTASKTKKADVLGEALSYVNHTEVEMRHMENEIHRLEERNRLLERLMKCDDCTLNKRIADLQVRGLRN